MNDVSLHWNAKNTKYKNFTDLGNYIIDLDPHTSFDIDRAFKYVNNRYDHGYNGKACTACACLNKEGEVLIGRNLDLTISQLPCYISHVKYGKYETLNFTYDEMHTPFVFYKDLLNIGEVEEDYYNAIPLLATDSMNSEGLYIECNMRGKEDYYTNSGTNPGKKRISLLAMAFLAASNCKTVKEVVEYFNEFDLYTINDGFGASGWNLAFLAGDKTGEFGLIEVARNEVSYIPYQWGHGNYYITPRWIVMNKNGAGYGRFAEATRNLDKINNEEEMLKHMKHCMWCNELLYIDCAYRDENGHIHFVDDKGNQILDWRSDFEEKIPLDENGNVVVDRKMEEGYIAYAFYGDTSRKDDFLKLEEMVCRCTTEWVNNDNNFEKMQKYLFERFSNDGTIDKLKKYYAGDEDPLRNNAFIYTTALSIGVNCSKKHIFAKFWENEKLIYEYNWD